MTAIRKSPQLFARLRFNRCSYLAPFLRRAPTITVTPVLSAKVAQFVGPAARDGAVAGRQWRL
jgi:hypothetical protein